MAGRGRGGGGRGRGRGQTFDYSQMGVTAQEMKTGPVLQPPLTYPPLEHRPESLKTGPENDYMVALKRDFIEFLKDKLSFIQSEDNLSAVEKISNKRNFRNMEDWESNFDWRQLPLELKPVSNVSRKRKAKTTKSSKKKKGNVDVNKKLDELAKLENTDEESIKGEEEEEKDEENEEGSEEKEEEDPDEEMDDGTDYVNNYFDNGESYFDDDDDNLDDGPTY